MAETARHSLNLLRISALLRRLLVGCLWSAIVAGCNTVEDDTRRSALEYFYGVNGAHGHLISSWERGKQAEVIALRRAAYGLNDDWDQADERVELKDLGSYEYFIRYSLSFRNRKNGEFFTREETYYSIGDEYWDPVPLKSTDSTTRLDSGSHTTLRTEALWRCDFDAFMERHEVRCTRPPTAR